MTGAAGVVVVDTMVISWLLDDRPEDLSDGYRELIGAAPMLLAFQTLMELRYGALRAGWGDMRRRRLERRVAQLAIAQPDDATIRRSQITTAPVRIERGVWIAAGAMVLQGVTVGDDAVVAAGAAVTEDVRRARWPPVSPLRSSAMSERPGAGRFDTLAAAQIAY